MGGENKGVVVYARSLQPQPLRVPVHSVCTQGRDRRVPSCGGDGLWAALIREERGRRCCEWSHFRLAQPVGCGWTGGLQRGIAFHADLLKRGLESERLSKADASESDVKSRPLMGQ